MIFIGYNRVSTSYRLYDTRQKVVHVSNDMIFDEFSVLEGVSSLSPEEDTSHEPTVSADSDDTPAGSGTVCLQPLPRSSHLVPVPPVRVDSPVRDEPNPVSKDKDEPDDGVEEVFSIDPKESYTDPGMRSDFLLQQADADEEMAMVPKWLIETLKDSGVTDFTSWNDSGPRTRSRDR